MKLWYKLLEVKPSLVRSCRHSLLLSTSSSGEKCLEWNFPQLLHGTAELGPVSPAAGLGMIATPQGRGHQICDWI